MRYILILLLLPLFSTAQLIETKIDGANALVWTPPNPEKPGDVTLFITGLGEGGTDINLLYRNGPFQYIKSGTLKPSQYYIAIQGPKNTWLNSSTVNRWIDSILRRFPVDTFNLTGLSMGARAIFKTISNGKHTGRIRNVVAMSLDNDETVWLPAPYKNIRLWALMGDKDLSHGYARLKSFVQSLIGEGYVAKYTTYSGGHDSWSTVYNPANTELYAWLNYKPASVPTKPPVVDPPPPPPPVGRKLIQTIRLYSDSTYSIQ